MRAVFFKKNLPAVAVALSLLAALSCASDGDYSQQAKAFHAQYAKSREVDLIVRYNITPRINNLYLQECQHEPEDTTKIWAVYENYKADDPDERISPAKLRFALTPFHEAEGKRIIPEYQPAGEAGTTGIKGEAIRHLFEAIRAFQKLGLREVICGGQGATYLVREKFMLIHVAETAKTPESIKNIATKLDENWYYEISLEHQQEQRLRLVNVLREFWGSLQAQKTDTTK